MHPPKVLVATVLVLVSASACTHGRDAAYPTGEALGHTSTTMMGNAPFPPGWRIGLLALSMKNQSDEPLTMQEIRPVGAGVGDVVDVVRVEAAPTLGGVHAMPTTAYLTEPPAMSIEGTCHSSVLRPLRGFVLEPGGEMRAWIVMEGVAPGRFRIDHWVAVYDSAGVRFEQAVTQGQKGRVVEGEAYPRPEASDRACLDLGTPLN